MSKIATTIPADVFEHIAINAGVLCSAFDTETWSLTRSNIIGATSGGINFSDSPSYTDYGDDIDNCPKNTKELKKIDSREIKVSGTFVSVTPEAAKDLVAAADLGEAGNELTPRDELKDTDFKTIWFVTDYGEDGAIAIRLDNALSTAGFTMQTGDRAKGTFDFEYTAHYSMESPDTVPYKIFFK